MIRILLLGVLLVLLARGFWRLIDSIIEFSGGLPPGRRDRAASPAPAVKLARDPVCGTHVPMATALSANAGSGIYYFCSEHCRSEFLARP